MEFISKNYLYKEKQLCELDEIKFMDKIVKTA